MISIIIPVFNAIKYIDITVQSVLKQTYEDFELILVDDGSTDGTAELLDRYKHKDKRVVVMHQINAGLSSSRDKGYHISKGDYIIFFDDDDIIAPWTLEMMVQFIEEADIVVVGAKNARSREIDRWRWKRNNSRHKMTLTGHEMFRLLYNRGQYDMLAGAFWGMLIDKDFFEKMKCEIYEDREQLPVTYMEDIHITYRFFYSAVNVVFLHDYYVIHRVGGLSAKLQPSPYAYELMIAGDIQIKYLKEKKEMDCVYRYLIDYYFTLMKTWWQIENYEEYFRREELKKRVMALWDLYWGDYRKIPKTYLSDIRKMQIMIFNVNPMIWKHLFGDMYFAWTRLCRGR